MEETKNELVAEPIMNQIATNIFGGDQRTKSATSLDLNDEEQADMLLNSMQDVDFRLNEVIGQEIEVIGAYVTERETDTVNEETGEVITRKKHTLMLFDKDGKSYVTGSNACYMSYIYIISIKGVPTKEKPLKLIPIKVDAKEKGHTYLKLKIAK